MSLLAETAVFLGAAIIAVPLFTRLGFGSVLGYLAAGIVIGPWGLGLIGDVEDVLHFAELGVVMLLFVIGLELQPSRLWVLRRPVFGMGSAQVLTTAVVLAAAAWALGLDVRAAIAVGLALSLSSTAFVLQLLAERKQLTDGHGRASFAILLFQDLAVIPMLALFPLLGEGAAVRFDLGTLAQIGVVVAVVIGFVVGGRYLLRPVLRIVSHHAGHEIFTATGLLVVIGAALVMYSVGLSMALGAFLAGVLLADSEYRHELEAVVEPFKGLLMGLFFISVGMAANLGLFAAEPLVVLLLALGLMVLKGLVLYGVASAFRLSTRSRLALPAVLCQGGEFAFLLFAVAARENILPLPTAELLVLVVTVSMALTPFVVLASEWLERRRQGEEPPYDDLDGEPETPVIIAGFGRVGQIIGRVLRTYGVPFTALDASSRQVDFVRRYGNRVYYGDPSRLDLLRAAGADKARVLIVAVGDQEAALRIVETARHHFPHLKILARAHNRYHAARMITLGVEHPLRDTFDHSLKLARETLLELEVSEGEAERLIAAFAEHDEALLRRQQAFLHDESQLILSAQEAAQQLEEAFRADRREFGRKRAGAGQ